MGFNFGAALGGATQSFQSTWRDMAEEERREKEQAYIDEQRKRESDYNNANKAIPTIGADYDPSTLPEYMRTPESLEARLDARRNPVTPTVAPPIDSSLEGAPTGLPVGPAPRQMRKATAADILAMQAAAARQFGYGEKALQFSLAANQEQVKGVQSLILREASTRGWEGLDDVVDMVSDGQKLQRRQGANGQMEMSYGGNQWVPVSSPMEAASMLSAAMASDPDKYVEYFTRFDSNRLTREAKNAQASHWATMAGLQEREMQLTHEWRMASLQVQRAGNAAEAARANAALAALEQKQNTIALFNRLMADPYANQQQLLTLAGQLAIDDPQYLGQTAKEDGSTSYTNKLVDFVKGAATDRENALKTNPLFSSGKIYRDPTYGGWRVKGVNDVHFDNIESAITAANDFYKEAPAGRGGAPADTSTARYTRSKDASGKWVYARVATGGKTRAEWQAEDARGVK